MSLSNSVTQYLSCRVFSYHQLIWQKVKFKPFAQNKIIIMLATTPHNIILFEKNLILKFPLLFLFQFVSGLLRILYLRLRSHSFPPNSSIRRQSNITKIKSYSVIINKKIVNWNKKNILKSTLKEIISSVVIKFVNR